MLDTINSFRINGFRTINGFRINPNAINGFAKWLPDTINAGFTINGFRINAGFRTINGFT